MMRDDRLIALFEFYAKGGASNRYFSEVLPEKLGHIAYEEHWSFDRLSDYEAARRHAAWMAAQAVGFLRDEEPQALHEGQNIDEYNRRKRSKREKAHRWLGFIQATLFLCGAYTLNELKEHSRKCSDEPEKEETKRP